MFFFDCKNRLSIYGIKEKPAFGMRVRVCVGRGEWGGRGWVKHLILHQKLCLSLKHRPLLNL